MGVFQNHRGKRLAENPESTENGIGKWPNYEMPSLSTWHGRRACLIGDAARATSPATG